MYFKENNILVLKLGFDSIFFPNYILKRSILI